MIKAQFYPQRSDRHLKDTHLVEDLMTKCPTILHKNKSGTTFLASRPTRLLGALGNCKTPFALLLQQTIKAF